MRHIYRTMHLEEADFRRLLALFGPSLGFWRAAEIAALREQTYEPPVLDLGCGDGLVTSFVLSDVEIGLDPDRKALEQAERLGLYKQFQPVSAQHANIPPGSIGTVLSNSVLEHIPELDGVLLSAAKFLKPGGRLIFTVPTEAFGDWLVLPGQKYAGWRNRHFMHLNLWPLQKWVQHLNQAGFEIEQVRPYLRHGWVTAWDLLELSQMVWIQRRRIVSRLWKRMPPPWLDNLAYRAARIDLSAPEPGGGRLVVARKAA